jgi:hypothetical protein
VYRVSRLRDGEKNTKVSQEHPDKCLESGNK